MEGRIMLSREFNISRLEHEKYQMGLSLWDKFVVWSYTLGSGTVNSYLLDILNEKSLEIWSKRIFETFRDLGNLDQLPNKYKEFKHHIADPFNKKPVDMKKLIRLYVDDLQRIILNAPPLTSKLNVYKASSPYSELKVGNVFQKPFNSTSYRLDMNFSMFLPPNGTCCLHKLNLLPGARVLILSPLLSAYPDEAEVILPHSVTFDVKFKLKHRLKIPNANKSEFFENIQEKPYFIGPVFRYRYISECIFDERYIDKYSSTVRF